MLLLASYAIMSYGGRGDRDRRDFQDRNRQGGGYHNNSRSYGNGDRRDNYRRDDNRRDDNRRGGGNGSYHSRGGRNDNNRSSYGGRGGRGRGNVPDRNARIYSFRLYGIDDDIGPGHFMEYFKQNNLKFFYVDRCAQDEFVFSGYDSDMIDSLKKHLESLNGSITLPRSKKTVKISFNGGGGSRQSCSSSYGSYSGNKRGPAGGGDDYSQPAQKRKRPPMPGSDFD
uniref:RRM domain-containing protein n=1 Tax=Strongyloides venezuelensis TaxID=75913 RepID=A0A0K0FV05_STRVS